MEDYTGLMELAMARGLVAEEMELDSNDPRAQLDEYGDEEGEGF